MIYIVIPKFDIKVKNINKEELIEKLVKIGSTIEETDEEVKVYNIDIEEVVEVYFNA
jgi:hypothetical protein